MPRTTTRRTAHGPANLPLANHGPEAIAPNIVDRLADAIVSAFRARQTAAIQDGMQAGLSEKEVKQNWDAAMTRARTLEPRMLQVTP